ncbi:MAG: Bud site selection protein, Revert to axial protein 1 [Geoglossum simile]|nr:MAG: Bud site selection protein, Revert to axial protein 1 [Geoglossum simile]
MASTYMSETRKRLPTLFEVISRRTYPPVDLFSFYIFMRDQQRAVDYLDFWLDVAQHMSLCRHYVRELRRSVLVATPELEKSGSKRSSQVLEGLPSDINDPAGPSHQLRPEEKDADQRLSAFLRNSNNNGQGQSQGQGQGQSPHNSSGSRDRPSGERPPRPSFMSTPDPRTDSNSPAHTVARGDIRTSAEKILYTFLLEGAEREIVLPPNMMAKIQNDIEIVGRDDPEVFDEAKDYVFQAMEREAFPKFLQQKALGNIIPPTSFFRLIIGLLALFGGFWAGFAMIFLDYPRIKRLWLILPMFVGVYSLISHQYYLDPILALVGFSEYTIFSFFRIKEPYVRKLLIKRSATILTIIILISACLIVLFVFVPGKRL